jgi:hypothetical protein
VAHGHAVHLLAFGLRIDRRADALEAGQIIHEQGHRQPMLAHQLFSQAPANTDIAVVVDNTAEQIEAAEWGHGGGRKIEAG